MPRPVGGRPFERPWTKPVATGLALALQPAQDLAPVAVKIGGRLARGGIGQARHLDRVAGHAEAVAAKLKELGVAEK